MKDRRSGNMAIEAAMLIPVLLLLIVGTVQLGKVTYEYYTVKKLLWSVGRALSLQQGLDLCNVSGDETAGGIVTAALSDSSQTLIMPNVTNANITVTPECSDGSGNMTQCPCDTPPFAQPAFLLVSIPDYSVTVRIPFLSPIAISMQPHVLVPFGGVS
jgi:Flp pilus assembly protein TadG